MGFLEDLKTRVLVFDGAMGTSIQRRGMQVHEAPEELNITRPEMIRDIYRGYFEAGSDVVETNTFGANRIRLAHFGFQHKVRDFNAAAVELAKMEAPTGCYVALSVGPTGRILAPLGDLDIDTAMHCYREQVQAGFDAGADLIYLETISDIQEMRAALLAAKSVVKGRIPIVCSLTFEQNGRTLWGTPPATAVAILEPLGADAIAINCSLGPEGLRPIIAELIAHAKVPVGVQPNAGLPILQGKNTIFPATPEELAEFADYAAGLGANFVGGCCGSTVEHIAAIAAKVKGRAPVARETPVRKTLITRCSSSVEVVRIGTGLPLIPIGERINPTGKKKLEDSLRARNMDRVISEARSQVAKGARVLDINVGVPGDDEPALMPLAVRAAQRNVPMTPLQIDSPNIHAQEAGLKAYAGRAILNSATGEADRLDPTLLLAKKYGAAVICLALDDRGIPETPQARLEVVDRIVKRALEYGLALEDLIFDCLTMTVAADQRSAYITADTIRMVKERYGVATVLGASNISFGLPGRHLITATFLAMMAQAGLDCAIINPHSPLEMGILSAANLLTYRDTNIRGVMTDIQRGLEEITSMGGGGDGARPAPGPPPPMGRAPEGAAPAAGATGKRSVKEVRASVEASAASAAQEVASLHPFEAVRKLIMEGYGQEAVKICHAQLKAGCDSQALFDEGLVSAMEAVAIKFSDANFFLPEALLASEAFKLCMDVVKPHLTKQAANKGTIVIATVKGDIHDIGKNIVGLMMENQGFKVINLGANVDKMRIRDEAKRVSAELVGLSALMTTTMTVMPDVIDLLRAEGINSKVMVGGAVLTERYARDIGASAYGRDAMEAVDKAHTLVGLGKGGKAVATEEPKGKAMFPENAAVEVPAE
ncbi:MAG: homocysteine S-methyltransferase family protein [bacterium]